MPVLFQEAKLFQEWFQEAGSRIELTSLKQVIALKRLSCINSSGSYQGFHALALPIGCHPVIVSQHEML